MKQKKKPTRLEKKIKYGSPAAYCISRRHKAAVQLNNELNQIAGEIRKNTKDLDPEFSVDKHFWELA